MNLQPPYSGDDSSVKKVLQDLTEQELRSLILSYDSHVQKINSIREEERNYKIAPLNIDKFLVYTINIKKRKDNKS